MNRKQQTFESIHFLINSFWSSFDMSSSPPLPKKKIDLKEIGHICWSAWRKKMFLLTLMLSWYLYYLFYDIFVMNDIQSTINNNKTSGVFVFFQREHGVFQLVVVLWVFLFFWFFCCFFFCTRCFCQPLIYINHRIRQKISTYFAFMLYAQSIFFNFFVSKYSLLIKQIPID